MKNVLVLTDFSPESYYATDYAYRLLIAIKADQILCNTIQIPTQIPMASFVSCPLEDERKPNHENRLAHPYPTFGYQKNRQIIN